MFCENCGAQIQDDSRFCESCGAVVEPRMEEEAPSQDDQLPEENTVIEETTEINEEKRCPKCGAALDLDARFCDHCGTAVPQPDPEPPSEPEPKPEPEPTPRVESDHEPEPAPIKPPSDKIFCMTCGKELVAGAAFCDACGAPTGQAYIPPSPEPALIGMLLSKFFQKPAETIKLAADKKGVTAGILFFVIKDALLAVLCALLISKISSSLGMFSMLITSEDTFLMANKVFLVGAVLDALWVVLLYGGGKVFQGAASWSAVIGAAGTASIALTAALLITAIAAAISPSMMICALLMTAGVLITTAVLVLEEVMGVPNNRLIYAIPAVVIVYALVIYCIIYIIMNQSTGGYDYL